MDPTIFDLSFNQASVVTDPNRTILPTNIVMPADRGQEIIDRLTAPQTRPRVRSRGAPAPAVEDRPLRLDLVHALALRAATATATGRPTTSIARTSSTWSRGCRCAATGISACACSTRAAVPPRRPPATTPRTARATFVSTSASTSAPSGATGCSTSTSTSPTSRSSPRRSSPAPSFATSCPPSACAAGSDPVSLAPRKRGEG